MDPAALAELRRAVLDPLRDGREMAQLYVGLSQAELAMARHQNATEQPAQSMPTGRLATLRRA